MVTPTRAAPKFLNLLQIRFPIGAIVSIGHRLSGALLVVAVPFLAFALELSLRSRAEFEALREATPGPLRVLLLVAIVWAAAHHVLAGVRHLLMDIGIGARLGSARASAWVTIVAALAVALAAAVRFLR